MHLRLTAGLIVACFAFGEWGCTLTSNEEYDESHLPLQTGTYIRRQAPTKPEPQKKAKTEKKKEEKKKTPKPETEPTATPAPEEESTPPPADRFR